MEYINLAVVKWYLHINNYIEKKQLLQKLSYDWFDLDNMINEASSYIKFDGLKLLFYKNNLWYK